ncbi:hypothetical protein [Salinispora pacifica]|uniref:hypothetical protein n=1 Tax=Salinispora pacifica TaxID=351187 RepID=UPI00035FA858|nr:hypothetical protein [Salinispora pacifica]
MPEGLGPIARQLTAEELEAALVALADIRAGYPDPELDPAGRVVADRVRGIVRDSD